MFHPQRFTLVLTLAGLVAVSGLSACQSNETKAKDKPAAQASLAKPGFYTKVDDGRLWVFREGSKEHEAFKQHGEPAKQVTLIGAGPNGMTIKSADRETIDAYMATW